MKKLLFLLTFFLSFFMMEKLMSNPTVVFGNNHIKDGKTHVPVIFTGFNKIVAISLTMTYDTSLFSYSSILIRDNSLDSGMYMSNHIKNKIILGWYATSNNGGIYVQDTLLELIFNNKKEDCGYLTWNTNLNENCEVSYKLNTFPFAAPYPTQFINRSVCVTFNVNIFGNVVYYNSTSPIYPVQVYLYSPNSTLIETQTSTNGTFNFVNKPSGNYIVTASTTKKGGGYNSIDALITAKTFVDIVQLDSMQLSAADMDNNGWVNATDAMIILNTFVSNQNSSSWIFERKSVSANSITNMITIKGICRGDVNNSYMGTTP